MINTKKPHIVILLVLLSGMIMSGSAQIGKDELSTAKDFADRDGHDANGHAILACYHVLLAICEKMDKMIDLLTKIEGNTHKNS